MAFGKISTLYLPLSGLAGASLWGTDVRKLIDTAPVSVSNNTKTDHGTGTTAVVRTVDPYSTSSTDADQSLYGWAIQPTDMNSVAGALRFYPAGNHTATIRVGHTASVAKLANLIFYAYRVSDAAGGRARTLLGSVSGASANIAALAGEITLTATLALGEIVFAADETIQYSFEMNAAGTVVTGDVITFFTGTQSSVTAKIDTPTLATVYSVSNDLVGDGVLTRNGLATAMSDDLVGDGVTTRGALGLTESKDLTGDGVVSRVLGLAESKDLTGDGVVSRAVAVTQSRDVTGDGVITRVLDGSLSRDLSGDGVLDATKLVTASKTFDLVGEGIVTEVHPVTASRTFNLTGEGTISGSADIPFPNIPTGDCPSDWSPNDGLKAIAGTVLFHEPPNQGNPVDGATVLLIRDSDGLLVATTTTDVLGAYSFPRDTNDPNTYHVEVRWTDGGTPQQGLSEGGCAPS